MMDQKCVLKTEGKFLIVKKYKDGYFLCAEDGQYEGKKEPVWDVSKRRRDGVRHMALCFKREEGCFSLKVEGITLKVEEGRDFTESHWFKVTSMNGSMQYKLQSVVVPQQCLSLDLGCNRFILSQTPAPITERKIA